MTKTNQEIFDTVADHLLKQGKRSQSVLNGREVCMYRGDGGLMCAIGCLILDDLYDVAMEGDGVEHVLSFPGDPLGFVPTFEQVALLRRLQYIHDDASPSTWAKSLRMLAAAKGLIWKDR